MSEVCLLVGPVLLLGPVHSLRTGADPSVGAQRVPKASVLHYVRASPQPVTWEDDVNAFVARHGRAPTDEDTLTSWVEALPLPEAARWLESLPLAGQTEVGAEAPTNSRLLADLAAAAAERTALLVEGQSWAHLVRGMVQLTARLNAGESGLADLAEQAVLTTAAAIRADPDAGPIWADDGYPAIERTNRRFMSAPPLSPAQASASEAKQAALSAAWVATLALHVARPTTWGRYPESMGWLAIDAVLVALGACPGVEAELKSELIGLLRYVPAGNPLVRDVRALRFATPQAAAAWAEGTSNLYNLAPIWPEVIAGLRDSIVARVHPFVAEWRAARAAGRANDWRGRPKPFSQWMAERGVPYTGRNETLLDDLVAAFLRSPGGAALRADMRLAAITAGAASEEDAEAAVSAALAAAGPRGPGILAALGREWACHHKGTRISPGVRPFGERAIRAALLCGAPDLLTDDEWAIEPQL